MANLNCGTSVIKNTSGGTKFFGFIPPYGKQLADNASAVVDGDLWAQIRSRRAMASLQDLLKRDLVTIERLPATPCTSASVTALAVTTGSSYNNGGAVIDVTFDDAVLGATTAANWTISGTGKGTLAANPNTVVLKSGQSESTRTQVYTLTWTAGTMVEGGGLTITAGAGITDTATTALKDADVTSATAGDAAGPRALTPSVGDASDKWIDIEFSTPMSTTGGAAGANSVTNPANYTLSGNAKGAAAANPESVALVSGNKYRLTWADALTADTGTVTVANVKDAAGNALDTAHDEVAVTVAA